MKEHWKKENLVFLVKNSKSQKEVLRKIGIREAGGNFGVLKKYINLYDLDTSHFTKNWEKMINIQAGKKIPIKEILVENSSYRRSALKERLYSEGLKERKCEKCGQDEYWHGEKISLILDHINGIYNDNRLINLRILCPNCNATLPTHCGKNLYRKKQDTPDYNDLQKEMKDVPESIIIEKYKNPYTTKKRIKDLKKLKLLKESDINFQYFGWVKDAAKILKVKDQVVNRWLKRVDPEFYSTCFRRKYYKTDI
jgi:hypothetical protein